MRSERAAASLSNISSLLDPLADSLDQLLDLDPASLSGAELSETLIELERQQARLDAFRYRVTARWDAEREWARDRSKSPAVWLAWKTRQPRDICARQVRLARHLRNLDVVMTALMAGELTSSHVAKLAALHTSRTAKALERDQDDLVTAARTKSWIDFNHDADHWRFRNDPDGPDPRDDDRRHLHHSETLDGWWRTDGRFTPLGGAIINETLERIEQELFKADWAAAKDRLGRDPRPDELDRTPAQRRHDALVEMARRAGTAPADGKTPKPLINIVVGNTALANLCETLAGKVIAPWDLIGLFPDAVFQGFVYDFDNQPVAASRQRTYRGLIRRAIQIRDRRCDEPGCFEPPQRCQIDHINPWSKGGRTTVINGRVYCGHHNRLRNKDDPPEPDP